MSVFLELTWEVVIEVFENVVKGFGEVLSFIFKGLLVF